jgi:4-amino-4-deoxy-L-arabinose transferase-like glycosyltransferase
MNAISGRVALWSALGLFAITMLALVLLRPLLPIDETRYLTVAWEMWQGGSKIVPHLNGALYTHKPPMLFWLMNLVWSVTGVNEIGARLVAPAFGMASVGLTALLARRLWPDAPGRAGLAALILASGVVYILYGSATMFDTMLTTATLAAMLALLALRRDPGPLPVLALGVALGFGVFAKGPVILVHVLPVALLYPLWADKATRPGLWVWYRNVALGVGVALGLVALWLGPALVLGGTEYRTDVLWRQSAGRMVNSFDHDRPIWFFVALLPVFAWPWGWSRAALAALAPRRLVADEPSRMVLIWALGGLVAFSLISGKQAHYLLPELPALALLLSGMAMTPMTHWRRAVLLVPALVVAAVAVAGWLGLVPQMQVNDATMTVGPVLATLAVVGALVGVVLRVGAPLVALVVAAPMTAVALHLALQPLMHAAYNPDVIAADMAKAEPLGLATLQQDYAGQFTFAGRLRGPVTPLATPDALSAWMASHPGGMILTRGDVTNPRLTLIDQRSFGGKDYRLYRVERANAP